MNRIRYTILPQDLHGHRFAVTLDIPARIVAKEGVQIQLPAWIPGSYMVRDFSKHIETISSKSRLEKIDSHTWFVPANQQNVQIQYQVYAFDTSVRAAYLDQNRGFFNPTSLCLQVLDFADEPHELVLQATQETPNSWEVETTLASKKIDRRGFGIYEAANYDTLIDHPIAMGQFQKVAWQSCGTPHQMVIQGAIAKLDTQQLAKDLKAICDGHIQFFEPESHRAPFETYKFIVHAVGDGYGGLEHRDSTVLLCKRDDLPYPQQNIQKHESYEDFLGLCSHEYFHAWMVKRIKPKAFDPYILDQKNYTRLLWLFEGFTSYYDDLQLFRSQRIDLNKYLKRLEKTWNMVLRQPGRHKQSVSESSFDAWTKYYQMDENTPNAVVSYYGKGALIAWALDLLIRQHTRQKQSLDDVIRHLWQMWQLTQEGMAENDFDQAINFILGPGFQKTWQQFRSNYIDGTKDLPLADLLSQTSIKVSLKNKKATENAESAKQLLGIRTTVANGWVKITHVLDGGLAQISGLAAGDYLSSIQEERVTPQRFDQLLTFLMLQLSLQESVVVRGFRHDKEFAVHLTSQMAQNDLSSLSPAQFSLSSQ